LHENSMRKSSLSKSSWITNENW